MAILMPSAPENHDYRALTTREQNQCFPYNERGRQNHPKIDDLLRKLPVIHAAQSIDGVADEAHRAPSQTKCLGSAQVSQGRARPTTRLGVLQLYYPLSLSVSQ